MSKFKKTCFYCGIKVDKLYESMCESCFRSNFPPIKNLKPLNVKYCNMCQKITINNSTFTPEEFKKRLPNIIKKNILINNKYNLKEVIIKDFKIKGNKVSFNLKVKCDLK